MIATVLPRVGAGHMLPMLLPDDAIDAPLVACLLATLNSLILDYCVRQKLSGTNLTYFILKQLAIPAPESFTRADRNFIVPRVARLTAGADEMRPWIADLGVDVEAPRDDEERLEIRAELDAYIAVIYGLTTDELTFVLDPSLILGADYPSETFRVLKEREMGKYGEFRSARLVLAHHSQISVQREQAHA
jgi:hypothetical protein